MSDEKARARLEAIQAIRRERRAFLDQLPRLQQRQDGTLDQLEDLVAVARKLGMYDAADWLRKRMEAAPATQGGTDR